MQFGLKARGVSNVWSVKLSARSDQVTNALIPVSRSPNGETGCDQGERKARRALCPLFVVLEAIRAAS